ncbi:hypothetical protein Gohar_025348 [Gossypium harknessii]|uniref:Uncharacterized protein n=1 Tax=Gossypium harknessii TaxID=34285 RepID=A0A7J9HIV7_9ROSI|nr:hypothetical protein [Gossypium harknessii]
MEFAHIPKYHREMREFVSNDSGTSYPSSFVRDSFQIITDCSHQINEDNKLQVGNNVEGKEVDNREMNDNAKRMEDSLLNSLANKEDEFGNGIQRNLRIKVLEREGDVTSGVSESCNNDDGCQDLWGTCLRITLLTQSGRQTQAIGC